MKALAGQGAKSIREDARRVDCDGLAVHRDVTALIDTGVIDGTGKKIDLPKPAFTSSSI